MKSNFDMKINKHVNWHHVKVDEIFNYASDHWISPRVSNNETKHK